MKKKAIFIINLISGTSDKSGIPALIAEHIDHEKFDYEIAVTQYAGHASEIATKAKDDGVDVVVAVGGDGTVNEVARAIVHSNTALGIIPCGSGNGLARHLLLPINVRKSIDIINTCEIHDLDGCDPTYLKHTDHTREYIPMIALGKAVKPVNLGTRVGFCDIAATVAELLGVSYETPGQSFASEIV